MGFYEYLQLHHTRLFLYLLVTPFCWTSLNGQQFSVILGKDLQTPYCTAEQYLNCYMVKISKHMTVAIIAIVIIVVVFISIMVMP